MRNTAVVVGGGLAGLCSALYLARAGLTVRLLEKSSQWGGVARTLERDGFKLNFGPHALFAGSHLDRILRELGIKWSGRKPSGRSAYLYSEGKLCSLFPFRRDSHLNFADNIEFLGAVQGLRNKARASSDITFSEWMERELKRPRTRDVIRTFVRVATYGAANDEISAEAALDHLAAGLGATYLDGGWQTIVDGLRNAATAAGVELRSDVAVTAVEECEGRAIGVQLRSGEFIPAEIVILAVAPDVASRVVRSGEHPVLSHAASVARPTRVAALDVCLDMLPNPTVTAAFGNDVPVYFSVHSAAAKLAPPGGGVVHVAKYVGERAGNPKREREELEQFLDHVQAGWRDHVVHARFLPNITVAHDFPTAKRGSYRGRPGPAVPGVSGLFLAGDWVGDRGMLADASAASAQAASRLAIEYERSWLEAAE